MNYLTGTVFLKTIHHIRFPVQNAFLIMKVIRCSVFDEGQRKDTQVIIKLCS